MKCIVAGCLNTHETSGGKFLDVSDSMDGSKEGLKFICSTCWRPIVVNPTWDSTQVKESQIFKNMNDISILGATY